VKAEGDEPCKLVSNTLDCCVRLLLISLSEQVLVVRTDLNMNKGKIAAQCGYVAV